MKLRTKSAWLWFGGVAAAWVVAFVVIGSQPEVAEGAETAENPVASLAAGLYLLTAIVATVYSLVRAQEIDWGLPAVPVATSPHGAPWQPDPNAAAIATVQAARQRRAEALAIVRRDPQMARDLRIGRPDLPRHFDDGGLVDVNSAPAEALVRGLGLSEDEASRVVDVRQQLGRFQHADDLMDLAGLDLVTHQRIQDRVILL